MPVILGEGALTISGQGAGSYGPMIAAYGTIATLYTLSAIGGASSPTATVKNSAGSTVATVNSPGTTTFALAPGRYTVTIAGGTVPTNVSLFRSHSGAHLEYPSQSLANSHVTELNSALQAGDTDTFIVVKASVGGDLFQVNRGSKLTRVNPLAPVNMHTLQE